MNEQFMRTNDKKTFGTRARAALGVALLMAGVSALTWSQFSQAKETASATPPVRMTINDKPVTRDGPWASFSPIVKKVTPSVVQVFVSSKIKTVSRGENPMGDNPLWRRFFGDEFGEDPSGRPVPQPKRRGMGSGVVVTKDGYILTNNHVVENADEVKVAFNDGREYTAKVVGADPKSDIAVLRIKADNLPAIEVADSDKIEVGDVVLAVGNPFGVGQTVTMGMVSATSRGNLGLDYEDFIQTDAAINPGNSGGALIDAEGRLIGINTAILSRSGGSQGIGFAVPANLARSVMESLVKEGRVVRGFMGVNVQDVTPALAQDFQLKESGGALVGGVNPKTPAEKAGVQPGDVIIRFNEKPVRDSRHLKLQVAQTRPGAKVPLTLVRDGKTKTLSVTVKELPGTEMAALKRDEDNSNASDALDGVGVSDLNPAAQQQLRLPNDVKGVLVTRVDPDSIAYEAGLREGDVIQEINRKPVKSAEEAVTLTENVKDKRTRLRVWSKGGSHYVVVDENKAG